MGKLNSSWKYRRLAPQAPALFFNDNDESTSHGEVPSDNFFI